MIKVNLTHSTCKEHVFEFEQEVSKIHQQLHQKTCEGNDFLGWLNYPNEIHPAMIDEINKMAQKVRQNCDVLVVIGIGGSYLGAKAAIDALNGLYPQNGLEIIYLGNTLSPTYAAQVLQYLKGKKLAVNVISKSGTTVEPALSFRLIKPLVEEVYKEKANEYISKGELVPDEITIAMVEGKLDRLENVLLDGFPRTIPQAEALDKYLKENNKEITAVINLKVPDEDIIKRTSSRVICSNKECGASFNTIFMPPKVEGICDVCGSPLIKRKDDEPETIKERLNVYYKNTEPLIVYYTKVGLLEGIDINIYLEDTKERTTTAAVKIIDERTK